MSKILQFISDYVRESFGKPVRLRRFLDHHPDFKADLLAPEDNIDMARVPQWHRLNETGSGIVRRRSGYPELTGWHRRDHHYSGFTKSCPALGGLVRHTILDAWSCDLQDVHGFAASKSKLETFRSMDEMVRTNSKEMIDDVSAAGLRKNLAHHEIRLLHEKPTDWLQVHQWDKRMYVVNDGGSHHLAAAKYIAARIGAPVPLRAPLHYYSIDQEAVTSLRSDYDIYLVSDEPELANAFFDVMESCGATWLWHEMPQPYERTRAIFLPREEAFSMRVSQAFREVGFVELGQHLEAVACSGVPEIIRPRSHDQDQLVGESDGESETENSVARA
jgi:hypothetical protein